MTSRGYHHGADDFLDYHRHRDPETFDMFMRQWRGADYYRWGPEELRYKWQEAEREVHHRHGGARGGQMRYDGFGTDYLLHRTAIGSAQATAPRKKTWGEELQDEINSWLEGVLV